MQARRMRTALPCGKLASSCSYISKVRSIPPASAIMAHQRLSRSDDGGWGESYLSCERGVYVHNITSQLTNTSWAVLGLLSAKLPAKDAIKRAIKLIMSRQKADGHWDRVRLRSAASLHVILTVFIAGEHRRCLQQDNSDIVPELSVQLVRRTAIAALNISPLIPGRFMLLARLPKRIQARLGDPAGQGVAVTLPNFKLISLHSHTPAQHLRIPRTASWH